MATMDNRVKLALAAAAAAVVVAGAAWFFSSGPAEDAEAEEEETPAVREAGAGAAAPAAAPKSAKKASGAGSGSAPASASSGASSSSGSGSVPKAKLVALLRDMIESMKDITKEREDRKQAALDAGRDEEDADNVANAYVQGKMEELDGALQAKHGISQVQMMEAQAAYAEEEDVAELVEQLKLLIIGPEQAAQMEALARSAPADMTAERFLPVFRKHLETVEAKVAELFRTAARDTQGRDRDDKEQYLQFLLYRSLESIQEQGIAECGMELQAFQGCMVKFGQDPRLTALVMESQARQDRMREQLMGS